MNHSCKSLLFLALSAKVDGWSSVPMLRWDRTAAKMHLQTLNFSLLTVGILKQVSAFRLSCVQAYADGLAAKHVEQQNKMKELELAKAEADAKAGSFGNFRPLRVFQVTAKLGKALELSLRPQEPL